MRYVLDTNTIIYFFKGEGNVSKHLLALAPEEVGVPAIVHFELLYGIYKSSRQKEKFSQIRRFTGTTHFIPFGEREAQAAAGIRYNLEKRGIPIGPMDVLIAATALANHFVLVTHNLKEFRRIPNLELEDWYD